MDWPYEDNRTSEDQRTKGRLESLLTGTHNGNPGL